MRFLSIILGCCLLSGCSGGTAEDMPEVAPVTGKVTLDGNSLKGVMIRFEPIEGGRSSLATSDDEGNYVLEYNSNTPGAKSENTESFFRLSRSLLTMSKVSLYRGEKKKFRKNTQQPIFSKFK